MDREEILRDTKMLLKNIDAKDEEILFAIDECINAVMAYCNLEILPYQLLGLIARMAAKLYRFEFMKDDGAGASVASLTEGDRKIDFSVGPARDLVEDYSERLRPFVNRRGRLPSELI